MYSTGDRENRAAHPFVVERLGDSKPIGDVRMIAVKGGIEAGNLQYVRLPL